MTPPGHLPGLRLALLGGFPFPLPQGSQVFAAEQAAALRAAGAAVSFFCYGTGARAGAAAAPPGVELVRAAGPLSRVPLRAGPSLGKPLADAALLWAYLAARPERRFDAALAHNAEAAAVALAARPRCGVPVIYVVHTLLCHELSAYGPPLLAPALERAGAAIDRAVVRAADAVIVLAQHAEDSLRPLARGPLARIPPGLDTSAPPSAPAIREACTRHGVEPGSFALYAGNLDRYQDLDDLARAAGALRDVALLIATHDATRPAPRGLRVARVADAAELRRLLHGAAVAVLPRRRPGGFPIKLLNYMEAGRAIVAREGVAEGLVHERSAWLLPREAGPRELAAAIRRLLEDPALAARLGREARARLDAEHRWPQLARRTLELVAGVARRPPQAPAG